MEGRKRYHVFMKDYFSSFCIKCNTASDELLVDKALFFGLCTSTKRVLERGKALV